MAVPRAGPKTSPLSNGGNRLVTGKLEFYARSAREQSGIAHWRSRLDHKEMVTRDVHGRGRTGMGRSMAAKHRSRVSQHRSGARIVLRSESRQTDRRMEQQRASARCHASAAGEYARGWPREGGRAFSAKRQAVCDQLGFNRV